jgi:hypothetical protein
MRRSLARFSGLESSVHTRYSADFIITTFAFRFSVHTGDERARSAFLAAVTDQILSYSIDPTDVAARPLITLGTRERQAGPDDPPEVVGRAIARNYRRVVRPLGLKSEKFDIRRFRELMRNPWPKKT